MKKISGLRKVPAVRSFGKCIVQEWQDKNVSTARSELMSTCRHALRRESSTKGSLRISIDVDYALCTLWTSSEISISTYRMKPHFSISWAYSLLRFIETISRLTGQSALLPLHVHHLLELEVGRICGEQTNSLGVGGSQADLRVDVQHVALAAAWRHNDRCAIGFIVLEVVASDWAIESVLRASLQHVNILVRLQDG